MKRKIVIAITTCLFLVITLFSIQLLHNNEDLDFSIQDIAVMAQAEDDYIQGAWGTNWKHYTLECTVREKIGINWILVIEREVEYTVEKRVCGYGIGTCLPAAGC